MKLRQDQIDNVLSQLSYSDDILRDLYNQYNGNTDQILKEYFNADVNIVFNRLKKEVKKFTVKQISCENRNHKKIDFPEINIWDENREIIKNFLNIKNYLQLKDIIADLMLEISLFILDGNEYDLPNKLGKIKFNKPLKQKNKAHNNTYLLKNRITRLSYTNNILSNKYKIIPRDRLKLLAIIDYLNNKKFDSL